VEQRMSWNLALSMMIICLITAFIPIGVRAMVGLPPLGLNASQAALFICFIYCQFWFPAIIFSYVRVSILDLRRRWKCLDSLTLLGGRRCALVNKTRAFSTSRILRASMTGLLPTGVASESNEAAPAVVSPLTRPRSSFHISDGVEPILPLDTSENVVAWLVTRRLLVNVGYRYFIRLGALNSQAVLLTFGVAVALLSILLTSDREGVPSAADIEATSIAMVELVLLTSHILTMLYCGVCANSQAEEHACQLTGRQMEARQACHALESKDKPDAALKYRQCSEMLEMTVLSIRGDANLQPVTILGLKADKQLLRTITAGALTSISLASALLRNFLVV
jgi:hypothetical protein